MGQLIGLDREAALALNDALGVQTRPLVVGRDGRVLLANGSSTLDALWEALDGHAKADRDSYREPQTWKAQWVEERVVAYLRRVFGAEAVYANLRYRHPDHAGRHHAELDAAVAWGSTIFLVEIKARQFSVRAQRGDVERL